MKKRFIIGISLLTFMLVGCTETNKVEPEKEENDVEVINYYNPKIYNQYKIVRPLCKNPIRLANHLKEDIFYIKENHPDHYKELVNDWESRNFKDSLDFILYIEC